MKNNKIIHVITGDGKGKTTASLGLALRALGANKKVMLIQFMKKAEFSEHKAIKKYKLPITVETFGIGFYKILGDTHTEAEHKFACQKALDRSREAIESNNYDLIILDEINVAVAFGLIDVNEVLSILLEPKTLKLKSCDIDNHSHLRGGSAVVDIILTGRHAHPKLKKVADLVSDLKCVKHYFDSGVPARKGIEF